MESSKISNSDVSDIEIRNLSDALKAIKEAHKTLGNRLFWRGHADESWKIQAEVFRPKQDGNNYNELSLINNFRAEAESRYSKCPQFDDLAGWLILARHYGLPTRLLDWTKNPLVAIYFAVYEKYNNKADDKDGCLWSLNLELLNSYMISNFKKEEKNLQGLVALDNNIIKELIIGAFGYKIEKNLPKVLACGTRHMDARVLAQQGSFTIHLDDTDLAEIDKTFYDGSAPRRWKRKFIIPHAVKKCILFELYGLGIRKSTLFPDLGALAEDLKRPPETTL